MDEQEVVAEGRAGSRLVRFLLLGAVLAAFTGQQLLNPVLAPLSREVRLSEVQLGLVITVAAVAFTLASLFWGRVCDQWGQRRVLLTGLALCTAGMASFAAVAAWATGTEAPSAVVLTLMLVTRSVLFGFGVGAVPVAALAYAGATTAAGVERTKAVSLVGAAQALAMVLGPGVGGLLAVGGLLLPVYLAPVVLALITVVVAVVLPGPAGRSQEAVPSGARRGRTLSPFDPRVRRFLAVGFMLFLSIGVMQVVLGFLFQDRLGLDGTATAGAAGAALFAVGLVLVAVQGTVVPRLGWAPMRLMRVGSPVSIAGFGLLAVGPDFWSMTAGLMIVALGAGIAMPGYTAGATHELGPDEQGAVAGLINATNGTTFIVGPLLGTGLYALGPSVPILLSGVLCLVACLLLVRPVRRVDAAATAA